MIRVGRMIEKDVAESDCLCYDSITRSAHQRLLYVHQYAHHACQRIDLVSFRIYDGSC